MTEVIPGHLDRDQVTGDGQQMFQGFGFMLPWVVFPYLIAAVMPTWRWLLACALVVGGSFSYLWIDYWYATQRSDYHEGAGAAIGVALFAVASFSFVCGVTVRAVSLFAWTRGHRKGSFWIAVFGIALPFAILEGPAALRAWQQRPAPDRCIERSIPIEIGEQRLDIPVAPLFHIHRGRSVVRDSYYMFNPAHVRDLCAQSDNGERRIHATNFAIAFDRIVQWKSQVCGIPIGSAPAGFQRHDPPPWGTKLCAAIAPATIFYMDPTDFPLNAYVYSLPEVKLGEFSGSDSTYQDSLKPSGTGRAETYVTAAEAKTPDGNPLTFACHLQSDGTRWCTTSYPWVKGTHLHYAFRTSDPDIATKGQRIDETLRGFLEQFQAADRR